MYFQKSKSMQSGQRTLYSSLLEKYNLVCLSEEQVTVAAHAGLSLT